MLESGKPVVAIIDYGMGNLFSIRRACESVGLEVCITFQKQEILSAKAVILPGVGAFGDAIDTLRKLDLIQVLQEVALSTKPFIGICLGMHLLMNESQEFGSHKGLGIIKGCVIRFDNSVEVSGKRLKVPHVGWNRIYKKNDSNGDLWSNSILEGLTDGEFMYFVHSFYVKPDDPKLILSTSEYGNIELCSSLQYRNIIACQFHPERSGPQGLHIYRNLASMIRTRSNNFGGDK